MIPALDTYLSTLQDDNESKMAPKSYSKNSESNQNQPLHPGQIFHSLDTEANITNSRNNGIKRMKRSFEPKSKRHDLKQTPIPKSSRTEILNPSSNNHPEKSQKSIKQTCRTEGANRLSNCYKKNQRKSVQKERLETMTSDSQTIYEKKPPISPKNVITMSQAYHLKKNSIDSKEILKYLEENLSLSLGDYEAQENLTKILERMKSLGEKGQQEAAVKILYKQISAEHVPDNQIQEIDDNDKTVGHNLNRSNSFGDHTRQGTNPDYLSNHAIRNETTNSNCSAGKLKTEEDEI